MEPFLHFSMAQVLVPEPPKTEQLWLKAADLVTQRDSWAGDDMVDLKIAWIEGHEHTNSLKFVQVVYLNILNFSKLSC